MSDQLRSMSAPLRSVSARLRSKSAPLRSMSAPLRSMSAPLRSVSARLRSAKDWLCSVSNCLPKHKNLCYSVKSMVNKFSLRLIEKTQVLRPASLCLVSLSDNTVTQNSSQLAHALLRISAIMNRRQINQAQSFLRVSEFTEKRLADFTHEPPTPVDAKFASARARLETAIKDLGGKQAIQAGDDYAEETEIQRQLIDKLHDELADVREAAEAISKEIADPSLIKRFRMPRSNGLDAITGKARAFAKAIRELSLNDELAAHGHPADTATQLETLANDLDGQEGEQGTALGERVGATASIPTVIRAGLAAIKTLDVIIGRIYKTDPATLAAWDTASHIQRTPRRKDEGEKVAENEPPTPPDHTA